MALTSCKLEYALCLVENYGEDQSNGSRTYTAPEESYRLLSSLGDLEVTAPDTGSYLIRRDRNNKISSNLRPSDVDNLKALIEFKTKSKASSSVKPKERKPTPRHVSQGRDNRNL